MKTGLFVIRSVGVRPLTLSVCIGEADGEIPMCCLIDSDWEPKEKKNFGSDRTGFEPGSPTFSVSAIIIGPVIHLQIFCQLICISKDECWFCFVQLSFFLNQYS